MEIYEDFIGPEWLDTIPDDNLIESLEEAKEFMTGYEHILE